jgi:putative effector of murein hydrolase
MRRDPRVEKLVRLRRARRARAVGRFYGTQATACGHVRAVSRQRDAARIGLALVLMVGLTSVLLYVVGQVEVASWLHLGSTP